MHEVVPTTLTGFVKVEKYIYIYAFGSFSAIQKRVLPFCLPLCLHIHRMHTRKSQGDSLID